MSLTKAAVGAVTTASALYLFGFPMWSVAGFSAVGFLGMGGWRLAKAVLRTGQRDAWLATQLVKLKLTFRRHLASGTTIPELFAETVQKHPDKPAIVLGEEQWTFKQVDEYSNRIANFFRSRGVGKGETVALFMENMVEYVPVWLGLSRLGLVASFINYNLRHDALCHSIRVCQAKYIVFSCSLGKHLSAVMGDLDAVTEENCFFLRGSQCPSLPQSLNLEGELPLSSPHPPPPMPDKSFKDHLCYIYTSGTTGLPKAVVIRHCRFFQLAFGHTVMLQITSDDVVYCPLPLYHSSGGILAVGAMLLGGATLVIRNKFSASAFWTDCIKTRATVVFYIGEICRYLLAQPPRPTDTQHCVRLATGNGLRPQIWREFQGRFKVRQIGEFYGSTEGNVSVINTDSREGAVGNLSVIVPFVYPVTLLKVDPKTGEHLRNSNGYCTKADYDEPGEIVGLIDKKDILRSFDGYHDDSATDKKILRNVFVKGDAYFLSGDILRMDADGYLYFCDRTGDTFRWKGENVSTMEVEAKLHGVLGLKDVVVYGVPVPGMEGKAGMATIDTKEGPAPDLSALARELLDSLPAYAVPVFVRLAAVSLTGTFKLQKTQLREEGFDPERVSDPLYVLDSGAKTYRPLDQALYQQLLTGAVRV